MAVTASKLKALVEADTDQARANIKVFSQELKKTASEADRDAKATGDAIARGVKQGTQQASRDVQAFNNTVKGWGKDFIGGLGVGFGASALASSLRSATQEAITAYTSYEQLSMAMTQLSARELMASGTTESMSQALKMAGPLAKDLLNWTKKLAIQSPFDMNAVSQTFKQAQAFGFTTQEAKRLTQALVDFGSGSGATSDVLQRISLSLGQMKAAGRLSGQELRELALAGLPVKQILADAFGTTTAEMVKMIEEGAVPADKAIQAIVASLEKDFGGAAARATTSWGGLLTSLSDIQSITLREFFTSSLEALHPLMVEMTDFAQSDAFMISVREAGQEFADLVVWLKDTAYWLEKIAPYTNLGRQIKAGEGYHELGQNIRSWDKYNESTTGQMSATSKTYDYAYKFLTESQKQYQKLLEEGMSVEEAAQASGLNLARRWYEEAKAAYEAVRATSDYKKMIDELNAVQSNDAGVGRQAEEDLRKGQALVEQFGKVGDAWDRILERQREVTFTAIFKVQQASGIEGGLLGNSNLPSVNTALNRQQQARRGAEGGLVGSGNRDYGYWSAQGWMNEPPPPEPLPGSAEALHRQYLLDLIAANKKAGEEQTAAAKRGISEETSAWEKATREMASGFESALKAVPGLFNTSSVTEEDMLLSKAGMYQPKADEYLRQLKDEVFNNQDLYANVDIREAASRAGLDPSKDPRALYTRIEQMWETGELFANPGNIDYFIKNGPGGGAVNAWLGQQAAAQQGQTNLLQAFGLGNLPPEAQQEILGKQNPYLANLDGTLGDLKSQLVTSAGKIGQQSPTILETLISGQSGGSTEQGDKPSSFSNAFIVAMEKDLLANEAKLGEVGGKAWDQVEGGFLEKAKASTAFIAAVDSMVENSLKKFLPNNK